MKYFPSKHHRGSIRLKGYDYRSPGAYYVTICAHNRKYLFGDVKNGTMILNDWGEVVRKCWETIPDHFRHVKMDVYVIMPDHIHGIVVVGERYVVVGTRHAVRLRRGVETSIEQFGKPVAGSIPTIIRSFKSAATKGINEMRRTPGFPVWQRKYYEHIIRDEGSLNRIRKYIIDNPSKWPQTLDERRRRLERES